MTVWQVIGLVFAAGGVGGLVNSYINDKGFELPHTVPKGDGTSILLPGFIGNMLIGSVAALVSWLLYGPLTQAGGGNALVNVSEFGGAILVGMSGSGWLSSAIDKVVLQTAVSQAALASPTNTTVAQQLQNATPQDVLKITQQMSAPTSSPISTSLPSNEAADSLRSSISDTHL
ncbi:hypothetical protein [Tengunoibacter tsumagoiensis]|uniref:Uncharacterized protein n=1 Tax=Tengunoibacter tsumagoiensis TaxID=2014871 RepID=A0A402A0N2_9CHLR|nr:hypothetical protein [Tengunoibacter tsumagoiensis]GCE12673.1 hypothetical protein KTT_25320 [Tengunoibacter tsumagoiensis]